MNFIMIIPKANMATNRDYYWQVLAALCMKLKLKILIKILVRIEKMFDFCNYSNKSKHYDNSKPLVFGKMKDKMGDVAAEKFVGLKPKIYSI